MNEQERKAAHNKASQKYDKVNTKMIAIKLNRKTDADIIAILEKQGNVQGFIKDLIRKSSQ